MKRTGLLIRLTALAMLVMLCAACFSACGEPEELNAGHIKNTEKPLRVAEATCAEYGYDLYQCDSCEEEYCVNIVKPKGHVPVGEGVVTAPTCSRDGYTTYDCATCGEQFATDVVKATRVHVPTDEGVLVPATECQAEYVKHTCAECGRTYTEGETEPTHAYDKNSICIKCGQKGSSYLNFVQSPTSSVGQLEMVELNQIGVGQDGNLYNEEGELVCKFTYELAGGHGYRIDYAEMLPSLGISVYGYTTVGDAMCGESDACEKYLKPHIGFLPILCLIIGIGALAFAGAFILGVLPIDGNPLFLLAGAALVAIGGIGQFILQYVVVKQYALSVSVTILNVLCVGFYVLIGIGAVVAAVGFVLSGKKSY